MHKQIRDKIYDELLIAHFSAADLEKYDRVVTADHTPCGEFGRANADDYLFQDI